MSAFDPSQGEAVSLRAFSTDSRAERAVLRQSLAENILRKEQGKHVTHGIGDVNRFGNTIVSSTA